MQINFKKLTLFGTLLPNLCLHSTFALAWWDCTWPKRVAVTITNSSAVALTNYEIPLSVNNTNFPGYVFANSDNDFRAVDTNDTTLLTSFVEQRTSTTVAMAWVKIPSLAAGASKTIYIYYAKTGTTNVSDAVNTFSQVGIRMWTRNSSVDPTDRASGEAAFTSATDGVGVGCKIITNFTNISNTNQFVSGVNSNLGESFLGFFNATVTGNWGFRQGVDYGRGGGMYMDDSVIEDAWNVNMWWNNSYAITAQTLDNASVAVSATGYHAIRSLGFEDCCDGAGEMQLKTPAGAYTTWSTANFTTRAPQCPVNNVTASISPSNSNNPVFSFSKTVAPFSDPINNTTNPKYIPGARARYTMSVSNQGGGSADNNSIVLSDAIPTNTKLYVGDLGVAGSGPIIFTQGSPSSTLTYSFVSLGSAADSVSFSNDGGATYTYSPVADANGYDVLVTNVRVNASGAFACATTGSSTAASFNFDVGVK